MSVARCFDCGPGRDPGAARLVGRADLRLREARDVPGLCEVAVNWRSIGGQLAVKGLNLADRLNDTKYRHGAASTAGRELTVLRTALGYAHRNGKLIDRPFVELPPRPPGRDRWLTRSEAAALLWESRRDPHCHVDVIIEAIDALIEIANG